MARGRCHALLSRFVSLAAATLLICPAAVEGVALLGIGLQCALDYNLAVHTLFK